MLILTRLLVHNTSEPMPNFFFQNWGQIMICHNDLFALQMAVLGSLLSQNCRRSLFPVEP